MSSSTKDVFISYTTCDRDVAMDIVNYLESKGVSCFIAPRDITPGAGYASRLTQAISECSISVVVCSDAINASNHMLNEIDILTEKKKRLVPFVIEDFNLNDDYRYYMGRSQRIIAYPGNPSFVFDKLLQALMPALPHPITPVAQPAPAPVVENVKSTKVFDYLPSRGIMINPGDTSRNVSFRTDTFINMFGGIFEKVVETAGIQEATKIFHDTGYVCGRNFATKINNQWDLSTSGASIYDIYKDKLKKWCEFDSDVGWGKFDIEVDFNNVIDGKFGTLTINECFIVDKQKKRDICAFVRGYCEGVIETLLDCGVLLKCVSCPNKSHFSSLCKFDISILEK